MSDNEVASMPEEAVDGPLDPAAVAALTAPVPETVGDGGPEMVQLLTPEGQRVENPEYDEYVEDLDDEDLRGFYRDLVLIRRVDAEATALQRQGELGIWASLLGQEAAQVGSGRALRPQDYAFPTYREHGVAWCRGVDPLNLLGLFRGVNHGGWDPNEKNFHLYTIVIGAQTLHATGLRHGHPARRRGRHRRPRARRRRHRLLRRRRHRQGDVNEAFVFAAVNNAPVVFFCQNNQWAISEPQRAADPHPALPARPRLRLPRRPGRRQRRARGVCRDQGRRSTPPAPAGPDPRRGVHLPDGRPHHLRRPDQVPRLRRGRGVEAARPDRAAQGLPRATSGKADQAFFDAVDARGRRAGRRTSARAACRCPTRRRSRCSTTSTSRSTRVVEARAARVRRLPGQLRGRGEPLMAHA